MMSKARNWRAMSEFSLLENKHDALGFVRNFSSEVSSVPNSYPAGDQASWVSNWAESLGTLKTGQTAVLCTEVGIGVQCSAPFFWQQAQGFIHVFRQWLSLELTFSSNIATVISCVVLEGRERLFLWEAHSIYHIVFLAGYVAEKRTLPVLVKWTLSICEV